MQTYDDFVRLQVWMKGYIHPELNPNRYRFDAFLNPIQWDKYGQTDSPFGWESGHIIPRRDGGPDDLFNLHPLQWKTNREQGAYLSPLMFALIMRMISEVK